MYTRGHYLVYLFINPDNNYHTNKSQTPDYLNMKKPQSPTINKSLYIFALKEGKGIRNNLLDYNLLLLQVGHAIHIASPNKNSPAFQLIIKNKNS